MVDHFPLSDSELAALAETILEDYESEMEPFQPKHLPEKKVVDDLGDNEKACFLTFSAAVDYRKETAGEQGLWKTMKRLWETEEWVFEPQEVVETHPYADLVDTFEERSVMAWQDPHIWFRNALTFHREYDGDPQNLFREHDWNAPDTLDYMRSNGRNFPYLKGEKISSLWLRLIHEEVHELEDIEEISIPVDSRIRNLTKRLVEFDKPTSGVTDGDIREKWAEICNEIGTYPVRLDQPLWLIEKHWEGWGEQYLHETV